MIGIPSLQEVLAITGFSCLNVSPNHCKGNTSIVYKTFFTSAVQNPVKI